MFRFNITKALKLFEKRVEFRSRLRSRSEVNRETVRAQQGHLIHGNKRNHCVIQRIRELKVYVVDTCQTANVETANIFALWVQLKYVCKANPSAVRQCRFISTHGYLGAHSIFNSPNIAMILPAP